MFYKDDSLAESHSYFKENMEKYRRVIPSEAVVTKNFREFCRMIAARLIDIKTKIRYLCEKVECECNILRTKSDELTERDKKTIRDYINKVELDIAKWTKIRNRLHKLATSENRMMKVFMNRHIL